MTEIPFEDPQVSQNFNKWVQKSPKNALKSIKYYWKRINKLSNSITEAYMA